MNVGLALSGGGVRAMAFHAGVLARLAYARRLGDVSAVSSVSGGSLVLGLILQSNGYRWPTDRRYLNHTAPWLCRVLTTTDLQRSYVIASMLRPWLLPMGHFARGRASILGTTLRRRWSIDGDLSDLPAHPRVTLNATCYQTGKNWRFERDVMGDYRAKYIRRPRFPLSHALAASAAVPGLIGPLTIDAGRHRWSDSHDEDVPIRPPFKRLQLWDGGVYDNLGVEPLFKPGQGYAPEIDTLLVSDASRSVADVPRRGRWRPGYLGASMRMVDIATDQVRSVRARTLIQHFADVPGSGVYLRLGKRSNPYSHHRGTTSPVPTAREVEASATFETTLRRLTPPEFSRLFRHGYDVAESTLERRVPAFCHRSSPVMPSQNRAA